MIDTAKAAIEEAKRAVEYENWMTSKAAQNLIICLNSLFAKDEREGLEPLDVLYLRNAKRHIDLLLKKVVR